MVQNDARNFNDPIVSRRFFLLRRNARLLQCHFFHMTDLTLIDPLFIQKVLKLLRLRPSPAKANLARRAPFIFFYFFNVTYEFGRD